MPRAARLFLALLVGIALGGCVVYQPMQGAAPNLHARGESEVTASSYFNNRVELAGSYSPVQHVLVRAAGSSTFAAGDSTAIRSRQYDLGLGTYWELSPGLTAGAIAGYGQAVARARFGTIGVFLPPPRYDYAVRYHKVFGEAYVLFQASPTVSFGASYRLTQVAFRSLTNQGQPVDLTGMLRHEPMFFFRAGAGPDTGTFPLQLQLAFGASVANGYNNRAPNYSQETYYLLQPRYYTTLSFTVFPHQVFRHH